MTFGERCRIEGMKKVDKTEDNEDVGGGLRDE